MSVANNTSYPFLWTFWRCHGDDAVFTSEQNSAKALLRGECRTDAFQRFHKKLYTRSQLENQGAWFDDAFADWHCLSSS